MIRIDVEQGSDEWFAEKLGRPSASNFDKIVTTKGDLSKQAEKYMYKLVAERLSGIREEGFTSKAMDQGTEREEEARNLYSMLYGVDIEQTGICFDDKKRFGASPDGLISTDGLLEIKCPLATTHIGYLIGDKMPTEYILQVQGQLFVTGRDYCDFMSYYPAIKPFIKRVHRDEALMSNLEIALNEFCDQLDKLETKLKGE